MNNNIKVTAAVSKTFEPFIVLEFNGQKSIMTPQEAIQHALTILENANLITSTAFMVEYFTNLSLDSDQVKRLMLDFKQFRERKKREKTNDGSHDDGIGDRG